MALRVKAVLDADGARFQQAMGRADMAVRTLAGRMATIFSVGAMGAFGLRVTQWASRMTDLATQTNQTAEEMQRLDRVAIKTGVSIDTLAKAFQTLEYKRGQALLDPTGTAARGFAAFGITGTDLRSMSARDMLKRIGSNGVADLSRMTLPLRDLFEETGPKMIEAFHLYSTDALQNMAVMSNQTAAELDKVADELGAISQRLKIEFAPTVAGFAKGLIATKRGLEETQAAGWKGKALSALAPFAGVLGLAGLFFNRAFQKGASDVYADFLGAGSGSAGTGGVFEPESLKLRKAAAARGSLYTDPLLSVGNFLGATGSMVNSIGEKQLLVQKRTLQAVDGINQKMDRYLSQFGGFGL